MRLLGYLELSKPDAKPVGGVVACPACEPKQLFLGCLGSSSEFRELLSSVAMFVAFVPSVSDRHRPVFAFLVNGYLVISMGLAFRTVSSHLFGYFHTDHPNFVSSG